MHQTTEEESARAMKLTHCHEAPWVVFNTSNRPSARSHSMTAFSSGTDDPWPDHGLNRLLATIEKIDANEFSEVECLEMLLYLITRRSDARKMAEESLELYGSLAKIFAQPAHDLHQKLGFDPATTTLLIIAKRCMKYLIAPRLPRRKALAPSTLIDYLALDLRESEQEVLRVIYLDTRNRIIRDEEFGRGTVNAAPIYPREIAKRALAYCASVVVLAHNHLSDDATPSRADVETTEKIRQALDPLDIVLHDHVIIARHRCLSMRQEGLLWASQLE